MKYRVQRSEVQGSKVDGMRLTSNQNLTFVTPERNCFEIRAI